MVADVFVGRHFWHQLYICFLAYFGCLVDILPNHAIDLLENAFDHIVQIRLLFFQQQFLVNPP